MSQTVLKERMKLDGPIVGCFVPIPSAMTVEVCARVGFEYILIDAEHGPNDSESAYSMILAAERHDVPPIVRVPMNHPQVILRYLDLGAQGVMIPQITSAEQAEAAVQAVRYYPEGRRGIAGTRASGWNINQPLGEFAKAVNQQTLAMVQIEHIKAVEALDEIIKVPGIDVLYIGPNDLAQSMGHPGNTGHPDVQATINQVCEKVSSAGIAMGTVAGDAATANKEIGRGIKLIGANSVGLLAAASREMLGGINN